MEYDVRLRAPYIAWVSLCLISSSRKNVSFVATPGCLRPKRNTNVDGDVQDVVFPCGYTIAADGDTINLYYGAADSSIALAHGSIRSLLTWLDANGHSEHVNNRRHK